MGLRRMFLVLYLRDRSHHDRRKSEHESSKQNAFSLSRRVSFSSSYTFRVCLCESFFDRLVASRRCCCF